MYGENSINIHVNIAFHTLLLRFKCYVWAQRLLQAFCRFVRPFVHLCIESIVNFTSSASDFFFVIFLYCFSHLLCFTYCLSLDTDMQRRIDVPKTPQRGERAICRMTSRPTGNFSCTIYFTCRPTWRRTQPDWLTDVRPERLAGYLSSVAVVVAAEIWNIPRNSSTPTHVGRFVLFAQSASSKLQELSCCVFPLLHLAFTHTLSLALSVLATFAHRALHFCGVMW